MKNVHSLIAYHVSFLIDSIIDIYKINCIISIYLYPKPLRRMSILYSISCIILDKEKITLCVITAHVIYIVHITPSSKRLITPMPFVAI